MLLFTHPEIDLLSVDEYPDLGNYNREIRSPSYCHILTTEVLTQDVIS